MLFKIALWWKSFVADAAGERTVARVFTLVNDEVWLALIGFSAPWPDAAVAGPSHVVGLEVISHGTHPLKHTIALDVVASVPWRAGTVHQLVLL